MKLRSDLGLAILANLVLFAASLAIFIKVASRGDLTFTSLLPRIAVDDPHKADWVIWYRANPKKLGVRLGPTHVIRHVYANGSYSIDAAKVLE